MFLFHGCPEYLMETKEKIRAQMLERTGEDCVFFEEFLGHVEHVHVAKEEGASPKKTPSGGHME